MAYEGVDGGTFEEGLKLFRDLPQPDGEEKHDDVAAASYRYDAVAREPVTYDNAKTAAFRAEWIRGREFSGAVFGRRADVRRRGMTPCFGL